MPSELDESAPLFPSSGGKQIISIEPKVDLLVDMMYWHTEAFNATSESHLKYAYDLLRKFSGDWSKLKALDYDTDEMHNCVDDWCGTLAGADVQKSWEWDATADYKIQRWEHLDRLKQVWQNEVFEQHISEILHLLGPKRSLQFLKSLCVRVPPDVIPARLYQFTDLSCPVKVVPGGLSNRRNSAFLEELTHVAEEYPSPPTWFNKLCRNEHRSRVVCYYTAIQGAFRRDPSGVDNVKVSQGIISVSGMLDYHFATPFGQALVACNWALAFPYFVCHRAADVIFQILLMWYLSPATRSKPDECKTMETDLSNQEWARVGPLAITPATAIAYFGLRNGVNLLIELATVMWPMIWRGKPLLRIHLFFAQPYPLFCYAVEIWSLWFAYAFLTDTGYICRRPFHLTILIFVKWSQFMLSLLNFSFLIEYMLPALSAMASKQSFVFLGYTILTAMGTSMAYYALPIEGPETGGGAVGQALEAFVRTFRLDFLSDYDEAEFEGIGQVIEDHRIQDEILDSEMANSFHWVLKIYILVCGLIFPVMAMNLYVSLLGEVYSNALKHDVHIKGVFQMNTSSRLLVQRYFWKTACCGIFGRCGGIFSLTWFDRLSNVFLERREAKDDPGFWIIIPEEDLDEMKQEGEEAMDSITKDAQFPEGVSKTGSIRGGSETTSGKAKELAEKATKAAEDAKAASEEAKKATESMKDMLGAVSTQLENLSKAQEELREEVKQLKGAVSAANSGPRSGIFSGPRSGAPRTPT